MKEKEKFNHWDYQKTIDGLHYTCNFDADQVIWGEYEDNPHGVNNETCISIKEFLDEGYPKSKQCQTFIKDVFGDEKLACFIVFAKKQQQIINLKMNINLVWNTEKGNVGYTLVIKEQVIELTKYETPVSSYSSGGMDSYLFKDFIHGSDAWNEVAYIFGENVAEEILQHLFPHN